MTEKTLTTENIKPALDALRGELAPWPVVAKKQDRLNTAQLNAANSGITSSLVAQIIANTAAIRALESAITGTGLRALVVASLPAVGTTGILYIVPVTTYDPDTDADVVNYSNEYIWIPVEGGTASEGHYEQVGQTGIVINNGQLTITVNGTSVGTFTANQSGDTTAAITVPTNADYVDRTTDQTVAGVKTFSSTINGTAAKAIADEDGTSIKTGYVNVAGNQTVTGQKTWSDYQIFTSSIYQKNNNYTLGNTVTGNQIVTYSFADSVNSASGYCRSIIFDTSNITSTELAARNKFKNGALDPTGSVVTAQFFVRLDSNGNKYIAWDGSVNNSVIPLATNTYSLGTSSYQWSSVYAQSYYYNGTAWGLDKENVWSSLNTFQKGIYLAGDRQAYVCPMWSGSSSGLSLLTNSKAVFVGTYTDDASGRKVIDTTKGYIQFHTGTSGTDNIAIIEPTNTTNSQLGTSTNKWKTLNGINPGALSLPDLSNAITLDTTNWVYDGATSNLWTATVDCWVTAYSVYTRLFILKNNTLNIGSVSERGGSYTNYVYVPARKGDVVCLIAGDASNVTVIAYPCLGNV